MKYGGQSYETWVTQPGKTNSVQKSLKNNASLCWHFSLGEVRRNFISLHNETSKNPLFKLLSPVSPPSVFRCPPPCALVSLLPLLLLSSPSSSEEEAAPKFGLLTFCQESGSWLRQPRILSLMRWQGINFCIHWNFNVSLFFIWQQY